MRKICNSTDSISALNMKNRVEICDWALAHPKSNLGEAYLNFISLHASLEPTTILINELGITGKTSYKTHRTLRYLYWTIIRLRDVLGRLILIRLKEQIRLTQKEIEEERIHCNKIAEEFKYVRPKRY